MRVYYCISVSGCFWMIIMVYVCVRVCGYVCVRELWMFVHLCVCVCVHVVVGVHLCVYVCLAHSIVT